MYFEAAEIKSFGTPILNNNEDIGQIDVVTPVELKTGGWTVYILDAISGVWEIVSEEFQGPYPTEQEAVDAGLKSLQEFAESLFIYKVKRLEASLERS